MRTLVIAAFVLGLAGAERQASAESIGLGIFVGEPTGLDIKLGLQRRGSLDLVFGATSLRDGRVSYGHVTYLYLLGVAHGESVNIPFRLGLGGAIYGVTEDNAAFAARVPFELGIRFRHSPLEIYGEIAYLLQLVDTVDGDIQGGVGLRVIF